MDYSEVLNLSIVFVDDAATIARCSLASKHQKALCIAHVQQYLPKLVTSAYQDIACRYGREGFFDASVDAKPLEWLYRTAGRAVVASSTTASALLQLRYNVPEGLTRTLIQTAIQNGMQLTTQAIVAACKARVDFSQGLDAFFPGCYYGGTRWLLPDNRGLPEVVVAICYENMGVLKRLLPQLRREQMADMLHIAVNRCSNGAEAVEALLRYDKQQTKLLHGPDTCSSTQNTDTDDSVIALVQELLVSGIFRGFDIDAVTMLAATPAAQALDAATVLKLLYFEVRHAQGICDFVPTSADEAMMAALCSLPSARKLTPVQIGSLMHYALMIQHIGSLGPLLELPQAQEVPPKQLIEMLLATASRAAQERDSFRLLGSPTPATAHRALLQQLAALDRAQHLAPGDAFKLLEAALRDPWTPEMGMYEVLEDLEGMDLGSQLTGSELLQLLVLSAKDGSGDCTDLAELEPAASLIDDEAGYVAFLEQVLDAAEGDVVDSTAEKIGLTQRLGPDSVLRLLRKCIADGNGVCEFILHIPALQQLPVDAAGELLLQAAKEGVVHEIQEVPDIPAVQQLSATLLQELLGIILAHDSKLKHGHVSTDIIVVPKLLQLPAAGQLTAEAVGQSILQVIQWRVKAVEDWQEDVYLDRQQEQQISATEDAMQQLVDNGYGQAVLHSTDTKE